MWLAIRRRTPERRNLRVPLCPAHHHITLPAAALVAHQPPAAKTALTVPTASAMSKAATHAMETATAEIADTYGAVVETHAVIDDVPPAPMSWPKP
jgi:hypothetical protein